MSVHNMPHHSRKHNGLVGKARRRIPFLLPDGVEAEGMGSSPVQNEMLDWWLEKSGFELAQQTEPVPAVAVRAADTNEVYWGKPPHGARPFFVMETEGMGKDGRPVRPVRVPAAEAPPQQTAYFRDVRFALLGIMNSDGSISVIEPVTPLPPEPPSQGGLF